MGPGLLILEGCSEGQTRQVQDRTCSLPPGPLSVPPVGKKLFSPSIWQIEHWLFLLFQGHCRAVPEEGPSNQAQKKSLSEDGMGFSLPAGTTLAANHGFLPLSPPSPLLRVHESCPQGRDLGDANPRSGLQLDNKGQTLPPMRKTAASVGQGEAITWSSL